MVEMVMGVAGAGIVAYPAVFIDVWGVGMTGMVHEATVRRRRSAVEGLGTVSGRRMRSATAGMASPRVLCSHGKGEKGSDQE